MGALISSLFGWLLGRENRYPALGPCPDDADPTTGLTPRQARAVLVTWDLVRPNAKHHGVEFFIRLFKAHPETQRVFKAFNDKDPDSLRDNKRMAAHGSTVMSAISNIVDNLTDPETLAEILKTTGVNHKRRGIKKEYFEYVKVELLGYLKENLGSHMTSEATMGWQLALSAVNAVVGQAYEQDQD